KPSMDGFAAAGSRGDWPRSDPNASGSSMPQIPQQESELESHHEHTIEQMFAKLKALLRKAAARSLDLLWETIGLLLDAFAPAECQNYLRNSGYVQPTRDVL
ncbi:MAG: hypothetical protein Q8R44_11970, partial [Novosphingobium sp.]|nr:hypothetical protein [Novosphingobium sp.]